MNNYEHIQHKLKQFIKRYHTNELIRGGILFLSIFLLYGLITLSLEHFIWFNEFGRTVLFWLFVAVTLYLIVRFLGIPVIKLLRLNKGLDEEEASKIIGNYFPEVGDKLTNLLQLSKNNTKSDLLLASIEQKSLEINLIPFHLAVNFKQNIKYLKYVFIPLSIILLVWISGKTHWFSNSYNRIIHYQTAYEPPAPFKFLVLNDRLTAIEDTPFTLQVQVAGNIIPENVSIQIKDENYYLQKKSNGLYEYKINQPKDNFEFRIYASDVYSSTYKVNVIKTPKINDFSLQIDYPLYTHKKDEVLKSTGNMNVPEGTKIRWIIHAKNTNSIHFITKDTIEDFIYDNQLFKHEKLIFSDINYILSTNNEQLKNYEELGFSVKMIKDEHPKISIRQAVDSLNSELVYYMGQVSDDYGLKKLELVYYPVNNKKDKKVLPIAVQKTTFDQFYYSFPNGIELKDGLVYSYFFRITDNDPYRGGKSTNSDIYNYNRLTQSEREEHQLEQQKNSIDNLDKSVQSTEAQKQELNKMLQLNKEKNQLNYSDRKKLENFIQRQKQQDELMKKFSKNLEENLDAFEKSETNELLKERLERQQKELEKNEKLMEEIEKLSEKIQKDQLSKRLEELSKNNTNNKRNLEQLLELTKRYYIAAKAEKLSNDLKNLAKNQEDLIKENNDSIAKNNQQKIKEDFQNTKNQLDELQKENEELKDPFKLERDKQLEQDADKEINKAQESLDQQNNEKAKQSQKNASQKMQKMANKLSMSMQAGSTESLNEDIEMLRQILDNLLQFSLDQENLMDHFYNIDDNNPNIAQYIKKQNDLKALFKHVDDSLFALSLRQPKMTEVINKNITDVYYNIDKSLEAFAETNYYIGVSNQQYAITATNELSDLLSEILDNLQQSMSQSSGNGKGSGQEMQLPDIIQSQEQINQQMQKGMKQQQEGKEGEKGKEGEVNGKQNSSELNEQMSEELFNLFQQQQQLRQVLEKQLSNKIGKGNPQQKERLLKEMERIENDLIEKGFNNETLQRMLQLKHQLLKLDNAAFEQGRKDERKSETNIKNFTNNIQNQTPDIQQYFNQVEILNRQTLPLRQIYKRKVQQYFKNDD